MRKLKAQYHSGKIKPIIQVILSIINKNHGIEKNPDYLMASVYSAIPELEKKDTCPNCGASML